MTHPFRAHFILSLFAATMLTLTPAFGQSESAFDASDPGPYYGFWEFQEPAGDTCVLIIKRGGRISCFWAGSSTRAIEKGSWDRSETALTAVWDTGRSEVFTMLGDNAIERATFESGKSTIGEPSLVIRGVRIDPRIPGSLTIKPEKPREISSTPPVVRTLPKHVLNSSFIGFWKVEQSTGLFGMGGKEPHFYLNLARNGEASVSLRDWEGNTGVSGTWKVEGKRAIITWPNNRRDVIQPTGANSYNFGTYKKKDDLSEKPRGLKGAEKVDSSEGERYFEAGNFKKLTVLDIRGTWVPQETTGTKEYISIEGWGNAYRFPPVASSGGTDPGKWRLENDRVLITWIDGSKDIIRLAIPNFVQDSFTVNEPMTGKPHRSVIVGRTKLKE